MTLHATADAPAVAALVRLRDRLGTLSGLLEAAHAAADTAPGAAQGLAAPALLAELTAALQADAGIAQLQGVVELLRSWQAALGDLARSRGQPSREDLLGMGLWFVGLQEFVAGRLDDGGVHLLAQLPEDIRWLPRLSGAFSREIARRLALSAQLIVGLDAQAGAQMPGTAALGRAEDDDAFDATGFDGAAFNDGAFNDSVFRDAARSDDAFAQAAAAVPAQREADALDLAAFGLEPGPAFEVEVEVEVEVEAAPSRSPGMDTLQNAGKALADASADAQRMSGRADLHPFDLEGIGLDLSDLDLTPVALSELNSGSLEVSGPDVFADAAAMADTQTLDLAALALADRDLNALEALAAQAQHEPPDTLDLAALGLSAEDLDTLAALSQDHRPEALDAALFADAAFVEAAFADAGLADAGLGEIGSSESGPSESGPSESGPDETGFDASALAAPADADAGFIQPAFADAAFADADAADAAQPDSAFAHAYGSQPHADADDAFAMVPPASAASADSGTALVEVDADTDARIREHEQDHRERRDTEARDASLDGIAALPGQDANDDTPIWIGSEELELTRRAILEQLLPLAQAWAESSGSGDAEAAATAVAELGYQSQLVVNVMELIGTPALARGMDTVRLGVDAGDPAFGPETVATWCSVLLAAVEEPGAEAAELLAMAAHDIPGLDEDWAAALAAELARVRIGEDPALVAARKTLATVEDIGLSPADDVLPSVLEGMLRELPDNAARLGAAVRALAATGDAAPMDEARRVAHTLKGDANTVGVRGLANLTHALEDILIVLAKRPGPPPPPLVALLTDASDCVEEMADHLLDRGPAPEGVLDLYQAVLDTANALADGADAPLTAARTAAFSPAGDVAATPASPIAASPAPGTAVAPAAAAGDAAPAAGATSHSLHVASTLLDELQRLAGESLIAARQIDQQLEGLGGLHQEQRQGVRYSQDLISRLDDLVALRGAALQSTAQKSGADLDPLEIDQYNELHVISRQLIEAQADSAEFMRRIERSMLALAELRSEQEQLNRELQRTVLRTRTVPFGQLSARLQRIVRQTCRQLLKDVELHILGEDIPVDAELLERIVEPLAHLLRNAIDHGIESAEERLAQGKPAQGHIQLRVGLQGDVAVIEIRDDGRGLDYAAIRRRGVDAGLLSPAEAETADARQLTRLILLPGFSTRTQVTGVSGRGIGMDVVNQRILTLRGTLQLASEPGQGMRATLRLPVTQTLANVIVVRGQRQATAVVSSSVERVVSFGPGECRLDAQQRLLVDVEGAPLPALPMESLSGEGADASGWLIAGGVGLLLTDAEGQPHVVLVQGIDDVRSVVVKPLGAYLPPIPAVRGVTQLGDGGLAPVIDLDQLLQSVLRSARERSFDLTALAHDTTPLTRVVVADDSLSVRRALEQLMQDAGFEVATARDGFEALTAIQAKPTHALLVDMEMPRMNGLELTRTLRNSADTRSLPVVMITSRTTEKHRALAAEAGVTDMLGKPFSEDSLVGLVRQLIAERELE